MPNILWHRFEGLKMISSLKKKSLHGVVILTSFIVRHAFQETVDPRWRADMTNFFSITAQK
jgi:hypothetical protein